MKKALSGILLTLIVTGSAFAQKPSGSVFTFGPKAGINYTTLIEDTKSLSSNYQLGYHGGAFIRVSPGKFYLQPEVLLTAKKTDVIVNQNSNTNTEAGTYKVTFTNVDVPLMIGTRLVGNESFNLRVFGGPLASFNLGGKGLKELFKENQSAAEYYEKTVWGFQAGAGFDLGALTFDARYERGLTGAANLKRADMGKPNTGLFQFSLGIKLL